MTTAITQFLFLKKPSTWAGAAKHGLLLASVAVTLAACASAPKAPSAEIQAAELAINNADRAQVIRYTSVELNTARNELAAAKAAVVAKNMVQAKQLATQAQLSAELAIAQAELVKAQAVNKDMQQSIQALQQEIQHNLSGVKP